MSGEEGQLFLTNDPLISQKFPGKFPGKKKRKNENQVLDLSLLKDPQMRDPPKSRRMVLLNYSIRGVADGSGFLS